jgi:hypothetical protein
MSALNVIEEDNIGRIQADGNTSNDNDTMTKVVLDMILNVALTLRKAGETH